MSAETLRWTVSQGRRPRILIVIAALLVAGSAWWGSSHLWPAQATAKAPSPPTVTVSVPLRYDLDTRLEALGQFSAVSQVEIRAQVGGVLTAIRFKDGEVVHKGDLLFVIDPTPYEIKLSQANAQLESARARLELTNRQLDRAQTLKKTDAGSGENVDLRLADQQTALAALNAARAAVRDARFDLDRTRITAPFTGRIGSHQVSIGNLVAGSRAASSPTTLLATIVSIDPIYLNFDLSEADYAVFQRGRAGQRGRLAEKVTVSPSGEAAFNRQGVLDFIDNALDRSSGVIHARATVSNTDFRLTPGGFARVRLAVAAPISQLLVPDAAVVADQSERVVMTVRADGTVQPKNVQIGELRGGLRVIRSGLTDRDKVIIGGLTAANPGSNVAASMGAVRFAADPEQD